MAITAVANAAASPPQVGPTRLASILGVGSPSRGFSLGTLHESCGGVAGPVTGDTVPPVPLSSWDLEDVEKIFES